MKNTALESRLSNEISALLTQQKTLQLATLDDEGKPYASYAPFAVMDQCIYLLLSEVAVHAKNLQQHPIASVLIIEDEAHSENIFARIRVNLQLSCEHLALNSAQWQQGVNCLTERHGEMITHLSTMSDFHCFKLTPHKGRYVKGFGKAFAFENSLNGETLTHLKEGHKKRA